MRRNTPYTEQEVRDMETIEYQFVGNTAYVRSPGYDDVWIAVQTLDTGVGVILDDVEKRLMSFWGDSWPKITLGLAKAKHDFYINKELAVSYDWPMRIAIRTYPAPDGILETLENGEIKPWIDRIAFKKKPHIAPEYQSVAKSKRKSKGDKIENFDEIMHKVVL